MRPADFQTPSLVAMAKKPKPAAAAPVSRGLAIAAFLTTFGLLTIIRFAVARPMLLADRFLPGAGWAEALLLAGWAAWLTGKLQNLRELATWRRRLWLLFSVVFFLQLMLGLAGLERFLMTGELHLPVPAMIVAGPLYRGEGLFMPILLVVTLLIVGPAWCSYLCYIGAWDLALSRARRRPAPLPNWAKWVRVGILFGVAGVAILLRVLGVAGAVAAGLGATFGLLGVGVMVALSRRTGTMVHCTAYCPIGVVATVGGKLSPFRMRITKGCDLCSACSTACRYDALSIIDIKKGRPGLSCTLCGDCLRTCKGSFIEYRFLKLKPETARKLFFVLVASVHAVFLAVARI